MNWEQVFPGILPLLGVIIGGFITCFTQSNIEEKKIKKELMNKRELRNIARLEVYSETLKINGEVLTHTYLGNGYFQFHSDVFKDSFRPVFYSHLYLLDEDVTEIIKKIDKIIIHIEHRENSTDRSITMKENQELFNMFNLLINKIENKLRKYQEKQRRYSDS